MSLAEQREIYFFINNNAISEETSNNVAKALTYEYKAFQDICEHV